MHYLNIELNGIDENGEEKKYKLSDFQGRNIIIYFYPQDDTPVCTQQAHDFRDSFEELSKKAVIIGVSKDDIKSHKEFRNRHNLNFIMLSDRENKLKSAFQEHSKYITNLHRGTFILNKTGEIIKYWDKVDADEHIEEIKDFIKNNNTFD